MFSVSELPKELTEGTWEELPLKKAVNEWPSGETQPEIKYPRVAQFRSYSWYINSCETLTLKKKSKKLFVWLHVFSWGMTLPSFWNRAWRAAPGPVRMMMKFKKLSYQGRIGRKLALYPSATLRAVVQHSHGSWRHRPASHCFCFVFWSWNSSGHFVFSFTRVGNPSQAAQGSLCTQKRTSNVWGKRAQLFQVLQNLDPPLWGMD